MNVALAVPNFSEGRDAQAIDAITDAFAPAARLDRHSDPVHNRTVLSLSAPGSELLESLIAGAEACIERIEIGGQVGAHPCVGALDVCPLIWVDESQRAAARELALAAAAAIADRGVPVFLYGELAVTPDRAERAFFRNGGIEALRERMRTGALRADVGPDEPHPTAGATLVTARPPLVAFNLELDTADVGVALAIAERLREAGGGLPGVRALGIDLGDRAQVSTNVHDPIGVPLATVVDRVRALAADHRAAVTVGEIVGLVPEASLRGWPEDVALPGFDPERQVLERRLAAG
jgi:glutamate formiminotransferase/glutamate formiminotransferase/formiminotetrahydrofolate cyclodeaminase